MTAFEVEVFEWIDPHNLDGSEALALYEFAARSPQFY